jgi:hypothetical protein
LFTPTSHHQNHHLLRGVLGGSFNKKGSRPLEPFLFLWGGNSPVFPKVGNELGELRLNLVCDYLPVPVFGKLEQQFPLFPMGISRIVARFSRLTG